MLSLSIIQKMAVWALPVLLAITLHEAAHAYVANRFGDGTAKMLGRLSFNPLRHIDPIGTILVPIAIGIMSDFQFVFGWAKPVPVNWRALFNPKRDMALVAIAGPASNFLMAFLWAILFKIAMILDPRSSMVALFLLLTSQAGILINLVLAFLNLLPIPPLDGSRVVSSLLPAKQAMLYERIEPFGFLILLALMFTGVLSLILSPLISGSYGALLTLFGL